ncbi:class I SAM-dependent methyltransferase [Desulfobotulus sp.]|uniref:class I SAM-dependent methyltransferase n=1 Tax=Desulfobotulus sp. TaxID=1940337 RepID=UPI002A36A92A|nr:class I SAM-dependent methyltransferase [Desulfobotulus sp.]MDY0164432.1 class I SAM-dependent methyltransferase [Desulfobotulus sp.]
MSYLKSNKDYYEKGYHATNVDHPIFRFHGRILKHDFQFGNNFEKALDFGCGQGAAVNFFAQHGFNAHGVDISETDITIAKLRYPHIANRFTVCHASPSENDHYGFKDNISVVTAIQSLYLLSDTDFEICINKIYNSMHSGAIFFATMMGENSKEFFDNSTPFKDGLRIVNYKNHRIEVKNYYMSFIKDEQHLKEKFHLFTPLHTGYYAAKYTNDEGDAFHYTFCGLKP